MWGRTSNPERTRGLGWINIHYEILSFSDRLMTFHQELQQKLASPSSALKAISEAGLPMPFSFLWVCHLRRNFIGGDPTSRSWWHWWNCQAGRRIYPAHCWSWSLTLWKYVQCCCGSWIRTLCTGSLSSTDLKRVVQQGLGWPYPRWPVSLILGQENQQEPDQGESKAADQQGVKRKRPLRPLSRRAPD